MHGKNKKRSMVLLTNFESEYELETAVFQHLISTGDYCLLKRQFTIKGQSHRVDILGVTKVGLHLVIFELKRSIHRDSIAQAESYMKKFRPRGAFVIFSEPMTPVYEKYVADYQGSIGVCHFTGEEMAPLITIRPPIINKEDKELPNYLMLRLSVDHMKQFDTFNHNVFYTDQWEQYNRRKLAEHGLKTAEDRKIHAKWQEDKTANSILKYAKKSTTKKKKAEPPKTRDLLDFGGKK